MARRLTKDEVSIKLKKHNLIWLNKEYKNNSTPILCIDKNGYKVMVTINNLNSNKIPSPFIKSNPYTIENIKIFIKNKSFELLSNTYIDSDSKLKFKCNVCNNVWETSWNEIKSGSGCPKCSYKYRGDKYRLSIEEIKNRLKIINKDVEVISNHYNNAFEKIKLRCKIDGYEWDTIWNKIYRECKCPKCSFSNMDGSYNYTLANRNKEKWKKEKAIVYIIKCKNDKECFYKIGITKRTVKDRFKQKKYMPYNYSIICEINTNLYDAVFLEKELHFMHIKNKYIPKICFEGYTECFDYINIDLILNIKKILESNDDDNIEYKTNFHFYTEYFKTDIRWTTTQGLIDLLVWVNSLKMSCDNLKIKDYKLDGFSLDDWITDINNKLNIKNRKSEEEKLKKLESKLESMLSEDKKIELELNEISKMI